MMTDLYLHEKEILFEDAAFKLLKIFLFKLKDNHTILLKIVVNNAGMIRKVIFLVVKPAMCSASDEPTSALFCV